MMARPTSLAMFLVENLLTDKNIFNWRHQIDSIEIILIPSISQHQHYLIKHMYMLIYEDLLTNM